MDSAYNEFDTKELPLTMNSKCYHHEIPVIDIDVKIVRLTSIFSYIFSLLFCNERYLVKPFPGSPEEDKLCRNKWQK